MKKKLKKKIENNVTVTPEEVPLDSSLGWLAVGDIAFTAWREKKKQFNKTQNKK